MSNLVSNSCTGDSAYFFKSLFGPNDGSFSRVNSVATLLLAEELLDDMEAKKDKSASYHLLKAQTKAYIEDNPELLDQPWLRIAGAVFDMIETLRETRMLAAEDYSMPTLRIQ